ncbi:MAG TPA: FHA domain-containing protein [Solirubrobacterales bacterium]|nr:FHA domain-containing protein [Solirubrobacterales bacterium]
MPGAGSYFCINCGAQLSLRETDPLPACRRCGSSQFRRDSIFEEHQEHEHVATTEIAPPGEQKPPAWLPEARRSLRPEGRFIAYQADDGSISTHEIRQGWTRIGRSANSNVCLDDPTVSRRHALIVAEPGKDLRVLDDRSLNGVFVNGHSVEWGRLRDGDLLTIGRFSLYALES